MRNSGDVWKLTDEDIYQILYLNKIEGVPSHQLKKQFSLSRGSLKKILDGKIRKTCYEGFRAVEKHLREMS